MKQMHRIMSIVVMLSLLLGATASGLPTAASQPGERGPGADGRIDVGLPTVPSWTVEGLQQDAAFSCSVSSAGDVNGDGYDDALIGARNEGPAAIGRAYAYYGSAAGFGSMPDWMVEGDQAAAEFGILVRAAGDLNGDGYDDVIVGASSYDGGQADEGRAYVYYGSASGLSPTPDWTAEGNQANARFGFRGGAAGDVNGDGYDDLIVGAYLYSNGQSGEGWVYVYYGSGAGLGLTPAWTAEGDQADAWFGVAAGAAGDVNGDGYDDVIVGAHQYDDGQVDEGRVFVYYGSAAGLGSAPGWTAESDQAYSNYGLSAGAAGDLNGDGYDDVIVGAFTYDGGETDEGRAYVYYGSAAGLSPAPGWIAEGDQAGSSFGYAVGAAGDVNGDGYDDVIVGAFFYDGGEADEGRAYVYYGSSAGLGPVPHWTAEADQAAARYGYAVGTAGRPIGGLADGILVGVYGWDGALMNNVGRVDLYLGAQALGFAKSAEDLDGWPLYEGDTIEYTIVVTNPNPLATAGVQVEDGIPAHTTYVEGSAEPPPTSGSSPLRWSDQAIAPGSAAVYRFRVTVDAGAGGQVIGNVAGLAEPGDTPRRIGPIVVPGPGGGLVLDRLEILKTAQDLNGPPLFEGDAVEYTILVTNPNPVDMPGVTTSDAIPDYTSYVEGSAAPPPTSGPDPLLWADQTVPAGATAAYRFQVTVDDGAAGQAVVNSAAMVAPGDAVTVTPPITLPDVIRSLQIAKVSADVNGPPLYEGDAVEYTILVTNPNPVVVAGVVVTDAIPDYTTYVPGSATPAQTSGPDPLVWAGQAIPAGATAVYRFQVTVDAGAAGQTIVNTAEAVAAGGTITNSPPITVPQIIAPLGVVKVAEDLDGPPLYEEDTVEYTILVTNANSVPIAGVTITDTIPAHTSYVWDSDDPEADVETPALLAWQDETIPALTTAVYRFQVTVDEGATGLVITNSVELVAPGLGLTFTPPITLPSLIKAPLVYYVPLIFKSPDTPVGDEYEDDDACVQARPILFGVPQAHTFDPAADEDWVRFDMEAGRIYVIQTGDLVGGADTIIQLYAPDCVVMLAENDDYGGELWSRIEWTATVAGSYAVRIINYDPTIAGPGVGYIMSVQELP